MKSLKQKIGIALLGVGLMTGSYFIGHYTPKYVTIDKSFIEEFESIQPVLLDKKIKLIKNEDGFLRKLILDEDTALYFMGHRTSCRPDKIDLKSILILGKNLRILADYRAPGELSKETIEFYHNKGDPFDLREMSLKEKLLWEKLYEELAR